MHFTRGKLHGYVFLLELELLLKWCGDTIWTFCCLGLKLQNPSPRSSSLTRTELQVENRLEVLDGVLVKHLVDDRGRGISSTQLVVPRAFRNRVLEELHAGGHLGEDKVYEQLRRRFYWPGYSRAVRDWCCTCATCATRKSGGPKNHAPLLDHTSWISDATDIMSPLPESKAGNSYILVVCHLKLLWYAICGMPFETKV